MKNKFKFLLLSQFFILIVGLGIFQFIDFNPTSYLQTNSLNTDQTIDTKYNLYTNQTHNQNSNSLLLSIHNYIQSNQTSKALLLIDDLYKENPNSSISYLVASHIFLLKDQNQLAYDNLIKAQEFQDYSKYNTQLDIQLKLILNDTQYFQDNIAKINFKDPNQIIHYIIFLSKTQNYSEIQKLFKDDYYLQNPMLLQLKQDYEYFQTFQDSNINLLLNLWAKTLIKNQYIHYARSLLIDAIKNDASSHNSYLLLSYCYILSENYSEALSILDKSKKIDPYNQNINFYLALLNFKEQKYTQALTYLQKIQDQNFETDKQKLLGLIYFHLKDYNSSIEHLTYIHNLNVSDLEVTEYLLDIYFNHAKNLTTAYQIVMDLEKNPIASNQYYTLLGMSYFNLNNSKQAENYLLQSLKIDNNHYPTLYHLGKLFQNKDNQKSSFYLNQSLKIAQTHNDKIYIEKIQQALTLLPQIN